VPDVIVGGILLAAQDYDISIVITNCMFLELDRLGYIRYPVYKTL